jgi:hypothetical protein
MALVSPVFSTVALNTHGFFVEAIIDDVDGLLLEVLIIIVVVAIVVVVVIVDEDVATVVV